jgi:hypothetical protein
VFRVRLRKGREPVPSPASAPQPAAPSPRTGATA